MSEKKDFVECGKIVSTQGIKGEMRVQVWGDNVEFVQDFDRLFLDFGRSVITVQNARIQKNMVILKLEGVDTAQQASEMRNKILYIPREDITLKEGEYLIIDLMGLEVYNIDTNEYYGTIFDITQTGGNDVYYIKDAEKVRLIPAIKNVIIKTDINDKKMFIRPLEGLFDD